MANFTRNGFGQVEPNQLTGQKSGGIFASLPLDADVQVLQNGEFMYYDLKSGTVTATGEGEPMLVWNEIKLYDGWRERVKDFAMIRVGDNYVTSAKVTDEYGEGSGKAQATYPSHDSEYGYRMSGIAPRLMKTFLGDVYTTNMVALVDSNDDPIEYQVGDYLVPTAVTHSYTKADGTAGTYKTLVLTPVANKPATGMVWVVGKAGTYTMPDGQPGLKIQRIQ